MAKITILIIGAVLFAQIAVSNRPSTTSREPSQEPQKQATSAQLSKNQHQPSQPSTAVYNIEASPQSGQESTTISRKEEETTNRRLMYFTAALAVVAALQFLALLWQVKTTRSTSEKELRAYVFPASATRVTQNGVVRLKVELRNSGKTPALECASWVFEGVANTPNPTFPEDAPAGTAMHSSYYIAPGSHMEVNDEALAIQEDDFNFISTNIRSLYLVGEIKYKDAFQKPHSTRFRMVSRGNDFVAGLFVFCAEGNSSD